MDSEDTTAAGANDMPMDIDIDDSLAQGNEEKDLMNKEMTMQDLFMFTTATEFDTMHRVLFGKPIHERFRNGESVTTASMLMDTAHALLTDEEGILARHRAAKVESALASGIVINTAEESEDTIRDVAVVFHEFFGEFLEDSQMNPTLSTDTQERIARIDTASKEIWNWAGRVRDWHVLGRESTSKDAVDIATFLARMLKKQARLQDSVATE